MGERIKINFNNVAFEVPMEYTDGILWGIWQN